MVHRSVYDFLTRVSSPERWYSLHGVAGSHLELATKCLRSMHAASVQDVKPDSRTGFSSFQDYARKCWSYHFERTGEHAIELVKDHPEYFKESPWRLGLAAAALDLDDLVKYILEPERSKLRLLKIPVFHSITMKILGTTPLHLVAQNGHLSTVKMLLETIPINSLEKKHYTPVFLAGMHGHIEVTELLLQAGADVTSQHPLHRVIWAHDEAMVKMLLGWSPSVSTGTLADATRVPLCVDGERGSMAALLLPAYARQEAKKAVLAKCSFAPAVVLDAAASSTTTLKTMKKLCELAGTDMNRERKEFGLRVARVHGNRAVVRMHIDDYGYSISEANGTQ
ncbi:GA-binding protein subunit beta-1 [Fusarium oxysporum f. sp. rapae]|uniref:GA-binding protein subunit beta-1 n=1 Tax=Fusarium oxysporum f. sp. rapae TaxID=485398 RepID=A0A8J5TYG7_FUSOX|nr:GA-binding protein subunit beta-1 [Fusarium oxysporum f. sp. rapae]